MRFVASLTRGASELRKIAGLWKECGDPRNPFENVLITPLFMPRAGMAIVREWKEAGIISNLYFDSGGYYVQTGRLSYLELYYRLLTLYRLERWADWYVLPDHVPMTNEAPEETWLKVRDTVEYSRNFFDELPDDLKSRAIPVVHGFSQDQVEYSLHSHLDLGTNYVGFGSFSTSGKNGSVNKLTRESYRNLKHVATTLGREGIRLHGFGVGTPPAIYILSSIGVFSFDSVGWMKTAGFGKVFLPFVRAYNITYHDKLASTKKEHQFEEMKAATGHSCYFCRSFEELHRRRYFRTLHNLSVVLDMCDGALNMASAREIMRQYSPDYLYLIDESDEQNPKGQLPRPS